MTEPKRTLTGYIPFEIEEALREEEPLTQNQRIGIFFAALSVLVIVCVVFFNILL